MNGFVLPLLCPWNSRASRILRLSKHCAPSHNGCQWARGEMRSMHSRTIKEGHEVQELHEARRAARRAAAAEARSSRAPCLEGLRSMPRGPEREELRATGTPCATPTRAPASSATPTRTTATIEAPAAKAEGLDPCIRPRDSSQEGGLETSSQAEGRANWCRPWRA